MTEGLTVVPVDGIGEVLPGADLAAQLCRAVDLADGDVLVVTSKVVSKAEDRVRTATREEVLTEETDRVVARRGGTSIVRTHHGLVMAAAGVDASNTAVGTVVLLPVDPDASARALRARVRDLTGANVAVLVTDTAGRAWRQGQTDLAVGAAGIEVLHDYAGRVDGYGNELAVTAPAVADELAGAADLVTGKLTARPAAVVRGLADLVLPPGSDGPGAAALVREESSDMFGLGAREAVLAALSEAEPRGFGAAATAEVVRAALGDVAGAGADGGSGGSGDDAVTVELPADPREQGASEARLRAAAHALGWRLDRDSSTATVARFRPRTP